MKQRIAKCVSDRAPVHTGSSSCGTIFLWSRTALLLLLKVEYSVSDRFLKWPRPDLNTFVRAEIAMELFIGKFDATTTGSRYDPTWNIF